MSVSFATCLSLFKQRDLTFFSFLSSQVIPKTSKSIHFLGRTTSLDCLPSRQRRTFMDRPSRFVDASLLFSFSILNPHSYSFKTFLFFRTSDHLLLVSPRLRTAKDWFYRVAPSSSSSLVLSFRITRVVCLLCLASESLITSFVFSASLYLFPCMARNPSVSP